MSRKIVTGKIRVSYLNVFEQNKDGKYSAQILIPKEDTKTISAITSAIKVAADERFGSDVGKLKLRNPLRDGDIAGPNGIGDMSVEPGDEPLGGNFFINASNTKRVGLLDKSKGPIICEEDLKSGDYCYASLEFYGYPSPKNPNNITNKGIACSLRGLMKIEDGEALGSDFDASEDFAGVAVADTDKADLGFLG